MNCANYYKKAGELQDHLQTGNPASERQILYVLPHTWHLPSNFHIFAFMWEQVYMELRKLEINGKRKKCLKEVGREEKLSTQSKYV